MKPSKLGTNLYPLSNGTAIAFWLDIHATAALTLCEFYFWAPWLAVRVCWLVPSTKHEGYYCLPPDIWIAKSLVLNHRLAGLDELRRNQHDEGFLLATISQTLPANAGQKLEALFGFEDLRGRHHVLPITLENRLLNPEVLRQNGEEARFPPPRVEVPTVSTKPTAPEKETESALSSPQDEVCTTADGSANN
jgi:hypothetical protein